MQQLRLINNSSQLNMFREIILPIFRSTRLCVTVCGIMQPRCCRPVPAAISKVSPDVNYPRIRRGDTEETTNSPCQVGSHIKKIRNIKVYSVTSTSAGGAFIQLLYFSPGFTSLLLYIKKPSCPFESSYMASFITNHTCGINTLFINPLALELDI